MFNKRDSIPSVLVTGGAGYIGSHTCKALAARGYLPVTLDNLSRGNRWAVKWGPLEQGDIAETANLRVVLKKYNPVALMHFAAYAYVGESMENPTLYYCNNVGATAQMLHTLIDFKPMPVVFSSSCTTYGVPKTVPVSEDHCQRPINPYGFSKFFVERILIDLGAARGLPWLSLRYFNAAGADADGEIGEAHSPETHLIPLVLRAARDKTPVRIFGDDYDTPDGTCIRDYVHVTDIADAHVRALEYLLKGGESIALNLANEHGYSVKDVIKIAQKKCGTNISHVIAPRREGDPARLVGDARRAQMRLGWKPLRSDLETQIADAWNWVRSGIPVATTRRRFDLDL